MSCVYAKAGLVLPFFSYVRYAYGSFSSAEVAHPTPTHAPGEFSSKPPCQSSFKAREKMNLLVN